MSIQVRGNAPHGVEEYEGLAVLVHDRSAWNTTFTGIYLLPTILGTLSSSATVTDSTFILCSHFYLGTPSRRHIMMPPIIDAKDYVGYSKLARFMSQNRDAAIFRRFGLLNMMNLLRLQAELQDLEQQLKEVWKEDREAVSPRRDFGKDFRTMRHHMEADSTQYDMLEEIGLKLREYSTPNHSCAFDKHCAFDNLPHPVHL